MESTLKDAGTVRATLEITVDADAVDAAFDAVVDAYARQVRVPGFRPGKAPRGVIESRVGADAVAEEVRDRIVEESYPNAIREHELDAVHAHAHGDAPTRGEAFTYELHVDLYPEVVLPDLATLTLDAEGDAVGDAQVQETVENLQREHATQVPVERPAEATDVLTIETVGDDGEPRDGSAMPIDLETVNEPLAQQLIGASIDDVVELELEAPHVHEGEEEARAATTTVRVADVKAKERPEPDDTFASTLGFESWDGVLDAIRSSLEAQAKERLDEARREELVEKLMAGTEVELPEYLVNRRKGSLLDGLARDLRQQGMEMDAYLAKLEADGKREEFERELQESAERAVKRDLVLERLLELRPADVDDAEFADAVKHLAAREGKSEAQVREAYGAEGLENYRFLLRRDKALRATVAELAGEATPDAGDGEGGDGADAG
ncbi:MAG: trigger factor [Trueperaceae bacterium]|nr:trigger factor [Trueperaceae bacterium]